MRTFSKFTVGYLCVSVCTLAFAASSALAQTPPAPYSASQAASDTTGFIGTLTGGLAPLIVAIAGGVVGLVILSWGVKTVFRKVTHSAKV